MDKKKNDIIEEETKETLKDEVFEEVKEAEEANETGAENAEDKNVAEEWLTEAQISDEEFKEKKGKKIKKIGNFFDKPLSRKFVIAALALTVIANTALSLGAHALTTQKHIHGRQNVSEAFGRGQNDQGNQWNNGFPRYGEGSGNQHGGGFDDGQFGGNQNNSQDNSQNQSQSPDQNQNQSQSQTSKASIGIVIRDESGVYIAQVTGENAKNAGFKEGDKIVSIDGKDIASSNELISSVQSHKAGDRVTVAVERSGQKVEIKTVLE